MTVSVCVCVFSESDLRERQADPGAQLRPAGPPRPVHSPRDLPLRNVPEQLGGGAPRWLQRRQWAPTPIQVREREVAALHPQRWLPQGELGPSPPQQPQVSPGPGPGALFCFLALFLQVLCSLGHQTVRVCVCDVTELHFSS